MTPRLEMILDDVLAADFSTPDGIRAFTDRARSEYTAEELTIFLYGISDHQLRCMTNGHESQFRLQWEGMADEAKALIAQIRALGAGGIKSPLIETADGGKVIAPYLCHKCDITTGKPIDELYDQTVVALRRMAARAMESNATVQDVAHKVDAARDEIAAAGADAHAGRVAAEGADAKIKSPRTDKGGKHVTRKNRMAACVGGVKFTAEWLAGVLNKSRFQPEKGAGWLGTCTPRLIQQWDRWCLDHPGEQNSWGYQTELRTDAGMYDALTKFIENWDNYWKDYKAAFTKWRATHKANPRTDFRPKRMMMRRVDIDPEQIARDKSGNTITRPKSTDEIRRIKKVAEKCGIRLHKGYA